MVFKAHDRNRNIKMFKMWNFDGVKKKKQHWPYARKYRNLWSLAEIVYPALYWIFSKYWRVFWASSGSSPSLSFSCFLGPKLNLLTGKQASWDWARVDNITLDKLFPLKAEKALVAVGKVDPRRHYLTIVLEGIIQGASEKMAREWGLT